MNWHIKHPTNKKTAQRNCLVNVHFLPALSRKVVTQSSLKLWVLRALGQFSRALRCQQNLYLLTVQTKNNGKLINEKTSKEESKMWVSICFKSVFQGPKRHSRSSKIGKCIVRYTCVCVYIYKATLLKV